MGSVWFSLICAIGATGTYAEGMVQSTPYFSFDLPFGLGQLAIRTEVNDLTVVMLLLVAFVGFIVARYSYTYLDGDSRRMYFLRWFSLTLGSFFTLIASGNMWFFMLSWIATSLFLNKLLAFYRDRPGAVLATRKKYLLDRIADVSLFAAFVLIVRTLHTSQFSHIATALTVMHGSLPVALQIASGLLVLSAVLKSAQFPFHGWLIQVMEAPTPVSALLHAGIIYTGAFLILRMAPLLARVEWAQGALILIGLFALAMTSLMMMTSTQIKGSLAYSTGAQMGFMLLECGLGLYSLAVLHIISHSAYKAHAFLSSGSVVDHYRAPVLPHVSRTATVWNLVLSLLLSTFIASGIGILVGVHFSKQRALIVMGVILTVAISQLFLQVLNKQKIKKSRLLLTMIVVSLSISTAYFGLDALFEVLLGRSFPAVQVLTNTLGNLLLGLITAVFVGLLLIQQMLPRIRYYPFWQYVYVHLYNGLYMDMLLTRWVQKFGPIGYLEFVQKVKEGRSQEVIS
ncbi:proton-conducting transporter membrane subunit [Sulfoacidibacillus thermotolerans]|nr:proton-conducting transporter membrane subunit [Sulfoacidibacillus thermotolerans]